MKTTAVRALGPGWHGISEDHGRPLGRSHGINEDHGRPLGRSHGINISFKTSVAIFGEISPLWQHFKDLFHIW